MDIRHGKAIVNTNSFLKKAIPLRTIIIIIPFALGCSTFSSISPLPYNPVITFSGIVGADSLYYPGNRSYPNTCRIVDGCVRMYLYSEDYSQGAIGQGDQMRIDVFSVDSQYISERTSLFVMTRYGALSTPTYNITRADTLTDYNNIHMQVESLEWHSGGAVSLTHFFATARPLGQFAGEPLIISRGAIKGRIE